MKVEIDSDELFRYCVDKMQANIIAVKSHSADRLDYYVGANDAYSELLVNMGILGSYKDPSLPRIAP